MNTRSKRTRIAALYIAFAILATAINLGTQALMLKLSLTTHDIEFSILAGTAVGLVAKFILDKRYIFRYQAAGVAKDGKVFILYTYMGVATTAIFWIVEYGFHLVFQSDGMRYLGGAVGLAIGYAAKYQLDKRYVFLDGSVSSSEVA